MTSGKNKMRLALVFGGESAEREVSLNTANEIALNLDKAKYSVLKVEIGKRGVWPRGLGPERLKSKIDLAFIALHGPYGEDGRIQGLFDMLHIPYTFSGVLASALAMDKILTQRLAEQIGITVPPALLATQEDLSQPGYLRQVAALGPKVVVKPNRLGSSVGVEILSSRGPSLARALAKAVRSYGEVVMQTFIEGREITAPVIGNREPTALPLIEIIPTDPKGTFYDYRAKYAPGGSDHIIPAPLAARTSLNIQSSAAAMHRLLGCRGASRADFIVDKRGKPYFLEVNTIPGMTSTSLLPQSAAAAGIPFPKLLDRIIESAFQR